MQNSLEQQGKIFNPIFEDRYSDVLPILSKNIPEEKRKDLVDKNISELVNVGFIDGGSKGRVKKATDFFADVSSKKFEDLYKFTNNIETSRLNSALKEGMNIPRSLFPNNLESPVPVIVLSDPGTDGKVFKNNDRNFGINLTNLFDTCYEDSSGKVDIEKFYEKAENLTAHESCHIYCKQLPWDKEKNKTLLNVVFGEGLAVSIEKEKERYPWHKEYVQDSDFWKGIVKEALNPDPEEHMRQILETAIRNKLLNKYNPRAVEIVNGILDKDKISDKDFNKGIGWVLIKKNGPIYHLGYKIWSEIYEKEGAKGVKQKILEGPKSFEKCFK